MVAMRGPALVWQLSETLPSLSDFGVASRNAAGFHPPARGFTFWQMLSQLDLP
jgi:hypothetical protein